MPPGQLCFYVFLSIFLPNNFLFWNTSSTRSYKYDSDDFNIKSELFINFLENIQTKMLPV